MLSRYLGQTVRVEGKPKLDGRAIMVRTAEVKVDQSSLPFYSPDILQMRQAREKGGIDVPLMAEVRWGHQRGFCDPVLL